ncbi:MAG: J domain-containing protein [Kofleriaceae bacterium]
MSITRRILDSAQSGISKFTSLVIADDDPLSNVESGALQAELAARKAARGARSPLDNPLAKLALGNAAARAHRDKAAKERAARVHRERDERETKQRQAADEMFRRMKEQAAKGQTWSTGSSSSSWSSSSSSTGSARSTSGSTGSARSPRPGSSEAQLAEWYRVLDLQPGADMAQIKSSYRQLMRKYHPDMHAGSPQKQKAATELSMRVTTAYNGLVGHIDKK